jgi:hypothetical protein
MNDLPLVQNLKGEKKKSYHIGRTTQLRCSSKEDDSITPLGTMLCEHVL